MRDYATRDPGKAVPHLYAVAESAYRGATLDTMLYPCSQQAVVVSGESGAGKSVAVKLLSEYLAWRATQQIDGIEAREVGKEVGRVLLLCRPALEAFGNSATAHNHNSSRFCKFISIGMVGGQFDAVSITTYLLERSRIVHHDPSTERNFHVFYWLLQAGQPVERGLLGDGAEPHDFAYLGGAQAAPVTAQERESAKEKLDELRTSLEAIGIPLDEQPRIFTLVVAVLHLGNISFEVDGSGSGSRIVDDRPLALAAHGLGVEAATLAKYLTKKPMADRASQRSSRASLEDGMTEDTLLKLFSPIEASRCRDSLAKALYGHLFAWLVRKMNAALAAVRPRPAEGTPKAFVGSPLHHSTRSSIAEGNSIGLLDIFGFESFAINSFEQLCINYANEQLHQLFVHTIFTNERAIHLAEGVPFPRLTLPDADAAIRAIAAKPVGVLWLLDSATRQPGSAESAFFITVNREAERTQVSEEARVLPLPKRLRVEDAFVISHFAGEVTYTAGGVSAPTWLDKNNSSLVHELHQTMLGSDAPLVQQLFLQGGFGANRRGSSLADVEDEGSQGAYSSPRLSETRFSFNEQSPPYGRGSFGSAKRLEVESVSREFISDLDGLTKVLRASRLHFVRTIKPNGKMAAGWFSQRMALRQLRCAGTHEAIHVMKLAYLSRVPYDQLFSLLACALPSGFDCRRIDRGYFVRCMLPELDVPRQSFALGYNRVFLKATAAPLFEAALRRLKEKSDSKVARQLESIANASARRWAAAASIVAAERAKADRREFRAKQKAARDLQRIQRNNIARRLYIARAREMAEELLALEAAEQARIEAEQLRATEALREALKEAAQQEQVHGASENNGLESRCATGPPPSQGRPSSTGGDAYKSSRMKSTPALGDSMLKLTNLHSPRDSSTDNVVSHGAPIPRGLPPKLARPSQVNLKKGGTRRRHSGRNNEERLVYKDGRARLPRGWPPDLNPAEIARLATPERDKNPLRTLQARDSASGDVCPDDI